MSARAAPRAPAPEDEARVRERWDEYGLGDLEAAAGGLWFAGATPEPWRVGSGAYRRAGAPESILAKLPRVDVNLCVPRPVEA